MESDIKWIKLKLIKKLITPTPIPIIKTENCPVLRLGNDGKSIMPMNANVFLHYGPYESCWIIDYRTKRLEGLINMLTKDGHTVQLKQLPDLNVVKLLVNGELVFSCDITDLHFGSDGELDELCHQAVKNVRDAF